MSRSFEKAAADVKNLAKDPGNDEKLQVSMSSLYKRYAFYVLSSGCQN